MSDLILTLPVELGNIIKFVHFLDNHRLVISTLLGSVSIWEFEIQSKSFELLKSIDAKGGHLMDVCISSDEKYIITAHGTLQDYSHNYIKFWDLNSGDCVYTIDGHAFPVQNIRIAWSSKRMIYSSGPSLVVWDIESNKNVTSFNKHRKTIRSLEISKNERNIYSICKNKIYCWDLDNQVETSSSNISEVFQICCLMNGSIAAICGEKEETRHIQILNSYYDVQSTLFKDKPTKIIVCNSYSRQNVILRFSGEILEIVDIDTLKILLSIQDREISPSCFAISENDIVAVNDDTGNRNAIHLYSIPQV